MPHLVRYTEEDVEAALFPDMTLAAAGKVLGITRERVRQLVAKYHIQRRDHRSRSPDEMPARWDAMTEKQKAIYARRSRWPREGIQSLKRRMGLCTYPGCTQPGASKTLCPIHRRLLSARIGILYAIRRGNGVCVQCSKPLASRSIAFCARHLTQRREAGRRHRKAQRKLTSSAYR